MPRDVTAERRCSLGKKREDRASSSCCFMTHNYCWRYNCQSTGQKSNWRACADQSVGSLFLLCNIYLGHSCFLLAKAAFSLSLSISFFQSFLPCFFRASMKSKQIRPNVKATRLRVHIPAMSFPLIYATPERPPPWYDNPSWDSVASRQQI